MLAAGMKVRGTIASEARKCRWVAWVKTIIFAWKSDAFDDRLECLRIYQGSVSDGISL
jgi:hypothetical protein